MGNKITNCIHYLYARFTVWESNMYMQTEYKICARSFLHFFYYFVVTRVIGNCNIIPVCKWMCACRHALV